MRTIFLSVVLAVGLCVDALSLNGRKIEAVGAEPSEVMSRAEKPLKRVRRGWMWNQFFLQEEYTGSDYQYIGKVRALRDYYFIYTLMLSGKTIDPAGPSGYFFL